MQRSDRYPPPDPRDPFAPLWVLRNKSASSMGGAGRRPWTVEASTWAGTTSYLLPVASPLQVDELGYQQRPSSTASLPTTPRAPLSPILTHTSPPPSLQNHYRHRHPPPAVHSSLSDAVTEDKVHQQTPEANSMDQSRASNASKSRHNRFSRLLMGTKRPSTSTGITSSDKENTKTGHQGPPTSRKRTLSLQPGRDQHQYHQVNAQNSQHHMPVSSNTAKPTISPPMVSSVVWESQLTGRNFIPIASSPLLNNAISVEHRGAAIMTGVSTADPLETLVIDASSASSVRHGRRAEIDDRVLNIKARRTIPPASISSPPVSRVLRMMSDDSAIGVQEPSVTSEDQNTPASPHGERKERASLQLSPIHTKACHSTSTAASSYIEVFSTPAASPVDELFRTAVSPTPPMSPRLPESPPVQAPNPALLSPSVPISAMTPQSASTTKAQCMCPTTIPVPQPPQEEWALPTKAQLAYAASLSIYKSDGTPIQFGSLFAEQRAIVLFLRHFFCPLCQDYVSSLASLVKQPILRESGTLCDFNEADATVQVVDGDEPETVLPKQIQLVLISCGKPLLVDRYKDIFKVPFRMYTDPEMQVYEALGMGKMKMGGGGGGGRTDMERVEEVEARTALTAMTTKDVSGNQESNWENRGTNGEYVKHSLMGGIAMVVMRAFKVGMPIWENGGDITQLGGEFVLGPGLTSPFAHRMQNPKGHAPVLDVLSAADVHLPDEVVQLANLHKSGRGRRSRQGGKTKENVLKKRKAKSLSISSTTRRPIDASPALPFQTISLNGHGQPSSASLNIHPPSDTTSGDEHNALPKRKARESFVTATLRSMGGNAPAGFKNLPYPPSQDTHDASINLGGSSESAHESREQGYYADRQFIPYLHRRPNSSRSHVDQEQTWMEYRQRDLEKLRQRKDERRRTGRGSISLSTKTKFPPSPKVMVPRAPTTREADGESVSVELSNLEFGTGSVESHSGAAGKLPGSTALFTERTSISKNEGYKTGLSSIPDGDDDLDDVVESGVVAVGGFISVPSAGRRGGPGDRIARLPKTVQAAIDLDLKMDSNASGKAKDVKGKKGKSHSISASMRNFWRS